MQCAAPRPLGRPGLSGLALKTDYRFTGQRSEEANFGSLYDYGARFYSPYPYSGE